MPKASLPGPSPAMLQQAAYEMLQKCTDAFPCNNLGLTATEFQVCFNCLQFLCNLLLLTIASSLMYASLYIE